jgi:deoxyribodipyrimidine photo-lyase
MKRVVHWFRRDLRVADNVALDEASRRAEQVIPVFVLEEALRTGPDVGAARVTFLLRSAAALRDRLADLGYSLIVRRGKSEEIIPALAREVGAEAVFCNKRYEPYSQARDQRVFNRLNEIGIGFEIFSDAVLHESESILTQQGRPYTVFTPYSKAWRARPIEKPRPVLPQAGAPAPKISSDALPMDSRAFDLPLTQAVPAGGELEAMRLFDRFCMRSILDYATHRDFPSLEGTSRLSAHFRCGNIGIRTVVARVKEQLKGAGEPARLSLNRFLEELIWREFYIQVIVHFPRAATDSFNPDYNAVAWENDETLFAAWKAGQTGFPIVDAAMRCLNATGWMHNRLRMVVAMFLTKDLLIDWRKGERYFMQQLVDGDLAANNGGWQWSAGTGTDAAPYFRIFNPTLQAERFDPEGDFTRRWVPGLDFLPGKSIHAPWDSLVAGNYPKPIVVHAERKEKFLRLMQASKAARSV